MGKHVILWDNDGVLVDTEALYYAANRRVLQRLGVALSAEQYRDLYLREAVGGWHLAAGLSAAQIAAHRSARDRLYEELLRSEPLAMPGAAEALHALAGRAVMGIVTSSRRAHFDLIHARTGLGPFFEFVVSGDDVARTKPDPEPYLRALAHAGRRPAECVAVEDSERGLRAAKAAGLECWVIPNGLSRGSDFGGADRVLTGIHEVPALLGS
ncbi:MAG: HAD family phosphatase [Desulfobacterales bacterium]|jgi:HAD superfamily hydrolase (TIGR01509 family)|nr:HAD family phosphatase [Desulfobacterales bacterium]